MPKRIEILIVDETPVCREALRNALADLPDIVVQDTAPNGKLGLDKARLTPPDLVLVGSSLPDVTTAGFTRSILAQTPETGVLVVSANTARAADMVIEALEAGAFDFIVKPEESSHENLTAVLRRRLLPKIRCFSISRYSSIAQRLSPVTVPPPQPRRLQPVDEPILDPNRDTITRSLSRVTRQSGRRKIEAVLIGTSTGGPEALSELIPALPATFPVPIVMVLHMPRLFTSRMAQALNRESMLNVKEGSAGDILTAGGAFLAPGGLHLTVETQTRRRVVLRTSDGRAENGCKPAVDVLFRSAAQVYRHRVLAVILTGMGNDGTKGLAALKEYGAPVIVQDKETSVVWGMPGSVVSAGYADEILPLNLMPKRILQIVSQE